MASKRELAKQYNPSDVEDRIYENWVANNCFGAKPDSSKEPFTVVIPPPNVTGQLHMGHALDETLQDILVRYKRMAGYNALWIPGTDHAGIATQIKVEEALRVNEEGLTRYDLGRDEVLGARVGRGKTKFGGPHYKSASKALGCSCDWAQGALSLWTRAAAVRCARCLSSFYDKGSYLSGQAAS